MDDSDLLVDSADSISQDELVVSLIEKERFSKNLNRKEYFVHWVDGTRSWEPLENLRDADGTENIQLLRYSIRKDIEDEINQDKPLSTKPHLYDLLINTYLQLCTKSD